MLRQALRCALSSSKLLPSTKLELGGYHPRRTLFGFFKNLSDTQDRLAQKPSQQSDKTKKEKSNDEDDDSKESAFDEELMMTPEQRRKKREGETWSEEETFAAMQQKEEERKWRITREQSKAVRTDVDFDDYQTSHQVEKATKRKLKKQEKEKERQKAAASANTSVIEEVEEEEEDEDDAEEEAEYQQHVLTSMSVVSEDTKSTADTVKDVSFKKRLKIAQMVIAQKKHIDAARASGDEQKRTALVNALKQEVEREKRKV